jgi:hypothetical protein
MSSTRMSKDEKEAVARLLEKHQKKHPGCKLSERRCRVNMADDCIGKGPVSEFHKTAAKCKRCIVLVNREYYDRVTSRRSKKKKVTFKKGTKKD